MSTVFLLSSTVEDLFGRDSDSESSEAPANAPSTEEGGAAGGFLPGLAAAVFGRCAAEEDPPSTHALLKQMKKSLPCLALVYRL